MIDSAVVLGRRLSGGVMKASPEQGIASSPNRVCDLRVGYTHLTFAHTVDGGGVTVLRMEAV